MAYNSFCLNIAFAHVINSNFTIIGSRLYSPNLKDVAGLQEAQEVFLISHTFIYNFFPAKRV